MQFNGCSIMTGWDFANKADFPALDLHDGGTGSDTWYPYWGADGRWYSTFTDGTVGGVHAQSGGQNPSMHGQVVVEPAGGLGTGKRFNLLCSCGLISLTRRDARRLVLILLFLKSGNVGDITDMTIVQAAVFAVNATPFAGNYPTGVFTSDKWQGKDIWYYGTYPVLGGNNSKWNEDCKNW